MSYLRAAVRWKGAGEVPSKGKGERGRKRDKERVRYEKRRERRKQIGQRRNVCRPTEYIRAYIHV